ncbi:uncharacterized protein LOC111238809 isoform X1 [Seriola dumerili]|uniref:uncharacterized protein LOC111238809 isoform X1 n=1 Tax=Seriola dumerili TaxID=41447 RepID=UPI000BBE241D|nr:uncharacterized protein LOC111238809 isoform X1 [Seriola dumerili]
MISFSLLGLCLLSLTVATAGAQSSDHLVMFALPRDSITLPCGIPSVRSCSSINWNMTGEFGSVTEVVKAGQVTAPDVPRHGLLKDCSLEINRPVRNDARLYTCGSGALNSSVSLQILELAENLDAAEGTIELHCFLNTYKGLFHCHNTGIHIKWSTDDNTPINGNRFRFENPTECFSKLIINKKLTDHLRKWKCQLSQNDVVKATVSYTTITDGEEEVFAAVGESVSLSCSNASSLGVRGSVEWAAGGKPLSDGTSHKKGQSEAFPVNEDSSLFIRKVSALNAGDYQCSESSEQKKVLNKIRLHTLDVTPQCGPGGEHLTLTCVLTCTEQCDKDFNLTWSGSSQNSWQSNLMNDNNTLKSKLVLPVCSMRSEEITCIVQREGAVMAAKKWPSVNSLQTPAWLALPLSLLMCAAAGGLYMCMKRKHNRDAANEQSSIGMTHVYDVIEDVSAEGLQQQTQSNREASTTTDSFYDLLQAVN